jgi:HSP20 family molecular chaperone IbpA
MISLVRNNSHDTRGGVPGLWLWEPLRFFGQTRWPDGGPHVQHTDDAVIVTMDMPGVAAEDIELTLENGLLKILGKRDSRMYAGLVTLGAEIDADRIESSQKHGVLTITAPKLASAKPLRIPIKSACSKPVLEASRKRSWRDLLRRRSKRGGSR